MDGFYSYLKEKFLSDNSTNNEVENKTENQKQKQNPHNIVDSIKVSDRDKLNEQQDMNEFSGVEKFKKLFKEKISDIFLEKKKRI